YPKILVARRSDDKKSIYFGPFPDSKAMKMVLRIIRKIFPYQSVPNHPKKICLYYHLGLCPCPPVFSAKGGPASGWDSKEFEREYRKNIKHIIDFLNGNTKKIIRELKKERDLLSHNENFEKAKEIQNKINAIELITGPFYNNTFDPDINPNFMEDLRKKEINDLREILNKNNILVENLKRIECYDISNISGVYATGSMVVFTNGEKDSQWYRRFKIKLNKGPNDFAMITEVLKRRLNHPEWPMPNLIIIDGGKGQVSSVLKVLKETNNQISLIGLAKKEETIITSDLREISLPKDSDALKLMMRIRDEAHRFAIAYHRKLRSKNFLD
ncbi:MAG: UvrB/UvrC motif-containing protein, partial [Patescibacteria group bacterium]